MGHSAHGSAALLVSSVCWLLNFPLFGCHNFHHGRLKFGMEVRRVCEGVCLCSYQMAKGGVAVGVVYCKTAHEFQLDSQTCTRFRSWS